MEPSFDIALEFARLVWLLRHRPTDIAAQKAALRAAIAHRGERAVRMHLAGGRMAVDDKFPTTEPTLWHELEECFQEHRVEKLALASTGTPAEVLAVARHLAADVGVDASESELLDAVERLSGPGVALTSSTAAFDSLAGEVERAAFMLDYPLFIDRFTKLLARESSLTTDVARAACSRAVRRLTKPTTLRIVVQRLVEDPARASVARRLLERCGNDGVEAVVDQYVNATSTGAREALKGVLDELPSTTAALKAMLGDPRPFMVVVAIGLLAERSGDDAGSVLGDLRAHADRQVRRALYRALARVEGQAALDLLIKGLGDSDTSVRLEAIASLAQRGGARVVTELSKALQNTENAELLHALLAAVGSIGTPDAVQQLASAASPKGILRQKRVPGLRSAAVAALGEMRLPSAQAALRTLATDRDRDVRDAVARALSGGKSAA